MADLRWSPFGNDDVIVMLFYMITSRCAPQKSLRFIAISNLVVIHLTVLKSEIKPSQDKVTIEKETLACKATEADFKGVSTTPPPV